MKLNKKIAQKILDTVDAGLSSGLGNPKAGELCIMAAFNLALGRPHSDRGLDDCVGEALRSFDIALNDCPWSSPAARAKGMRREAMAKIGSNQLDQVEFSKRLALKVNQTILPRALRAVASLFKDSHKEALEAAACRCEKSKDLVEAESAARSAESAARSAESAESAAWSAARSAESAARSAAESAASAAWSAARSAAESAASAARSAAESAASAAESAARSAAWSAAADKIFSEVAEICVQVLIEMKSPGVKWLSLCDK